MQAVLKTEPFLLDMFVRSEWGSLGLNYFLATILGYMGHRTLFLLQLGVKLGHPIVRSLLPCEPGCERFWSSLMETIHAKKIIQYWFLGQIYKQLTPRIFDKARAP